MDKKLLQELREAYDRYYELIKDSTKEHMVFNRIVSLKSSYKPN